MMLACEPFFGLVLPQAWLNKNTELTENSQKEHLFLKKIFSNSSKQTEAVYCLSSVFSKVFSLFLTIFHVIYAIDYKDNAK